MPIFLSALAISLASATSISSVTNTVSITKKFANLPTKNSNSVSNVGIDSQEVLLSKNLSTAINNLKEHSNLSDDKVKAIVENSIIYDENGGLEFSLSRLKELEKTEFFQIIASNKDLSKKMLSQLSEGNLVQYNPETKSFHFKDAQPTTLNSHIWVVYEWSWFAYWELHFDHTMSQFLFYLGENGGNLMDFLEAIGEVEGLWAIGASLLSVVCHSLAYYFGERDNGNGVYIGWDAVVPRGVVAR